MADHLAAEVQIGGKVRRSATEALSQAIAAEGVSLEWGDVSFKPQTADDLLAARRDDGEGRLLLTLYDDEAPWGEFDVLEAFLREQGIAYRRYSEGKYDYDPEISVFHPASGLVELATNNNRQPVVPASELAPIADALAKLLAEMRGEDVPSEKLQRKLQRIHGKLRKCLPPEVPALESFEIIEG